MTFIWQPEPLPERLTTEGAANMTNAEIAALLEEAAYHLQGNRYVATKRFRDAAAELRQRMEREDALYLLLGGRDIAEVVESEKQLKRSVEALRDLVDGILYDRKQPCGHPQACDITDGGNVCGWCADLAEAAKGKP